MHVLELDMVVGERIERKVVGVWVCDAFWNDYYVVFSDLIANPSLS